MSGQIILDSDEEEDEGSIGDVADNEPTNGLDEIKLGTTTPGLNTWQTSSRETANSSAKLRSQIQRAQSDLVEPTPSKKRRTANHLDISLGISPGTSERKRSRSISTAEDHKSGTLKSYSKKATVRTGRKLDPEETWEVPEDLSQAHKEDNLDVARAARAQEGLQNVRQPSSDATIMDSSRRNYSSNDALEPTMYTEVATQVAPESSPNAHNTELSFITVDPTTSSTVSKRARISTSSQDLGTLCDIEKIPNPPSPDDELQVETALNVPMSRSNDSTDETPLVVINVNNRPDDDMGRTSTVTGGKKRKATHEDTMDELEPEEFVGLPRENYEPRPTRSRGALRESAGSSVAAPATATEKSKSKLKRQKTAEHVTKADKLALCDMGFRSSQVEKALDEADGDVNSAIELLTTHVSEVLNPPKKKCDDSHRKRKSREREPEAEMPEQSQEDVIVIEHNSVSRLRKMQGSLAAASAETQTEESSANGNEENKKGTKADKSNVSEEPSKTSRKGKRGRGRPKKENVETNQEETEKGPAEHGDGDDDESAVESKVVSEGSGNANKKGANHAKGEQAVDTLETGLITEQGTAAAKMEHREVLQDIDTNRDHQDDDDEDDVDKGMSDGNSRSDEKISMSTPEKSIQKPAESSKKPHSPLNSSKVPLKVGLSRRARIEPLLRIIKK